MRKKVLVIPVAIAALVAVLFVAFAPTATAKDFTILEFNTMVGVPRPYTGATNAIRGVPGGGLPWVIGSGEGELKANGKLEIRVTGLVLDPSDPTVIASGRAGTNPIPNFKAIVSCLSKDASGNATTVNVSTGLFPASTTGNASIEATVALPKPCIAPIVFVTSPPSTSAPIGAWFASTGF